MTGYLSFGCNRIVMRLGLGTNRLAGPGVWGEPADKDGAIALLRRAVELGINFIDTADSYGPFVTEEIIARALHPYAGVTIATKGGLVRTGPDKWHPLGRPEYLRQCVEMSLRRLRVDCIDLYQLHRLDPAVPVADQLGALVEMHDEGKIDLIGLSKVTVDEIELARTISPVATVQNLYNLACRQSDDVVDYCEREGLAFLPFFPLAIGELALPGSPVAAVARATGHTAAQLALAWLLHRSPLMLPIPGTASYVHLAENVASTRIELSGDQVAALDALGRS